MALNLISRFSRNAARLAPGIRHLTTTQSTASLFSIKNESNLVTISKLTCNSGYFNSARLYSSENTLSKNQIEEKVLEILRNFDRVKENPKKPTVTLESHLAKDLGLDSLDHVEIIVQLEEAFGYEVPDSDYEKLYTPNEIVNYIGKRLASV